MARCLRALLLLVPCLALARSAAAAPPTVTITDPNAPGQSVALSKVVSGTFTGRDDPNSPTENFTVTVNGEEALLFAPDIFRARVELPLGPSTLTVIASDDEGTDTKTLAVIGDAPPVLTITAPVDGFSTGDVSVEVRGSIADDNLDPNDPNTLVVGGTLVPLDPNDPTHSFAQKVVIAAGTQDLRFTVRDLAGNIVNETVEVTRTIVCEDPLFPATASTDPNAPRLYRVNRPDDLPMPSSFDPNAPFPVCDVRPALRTAPPPFNPPGIGNCTLRAAVQAANAHPGPDVIQLFNGTIRLTRSGAGEDLAARGDLDVTEDLVLAGFGRDASVIDARKLGDRVFDVAEGVELTLVTASVRGGSTPKVKKGVASESGGCIRAVGPPVCNEPGDTFPPCLSVHLNNAALLDCKSGADGGALALADADAALTCTIVARSSAKADGGGIFVEDGALSLRNSTIALSSAARGGALAIRGGTLVTSNATFSGNKAKTAGGGLALAGGAEATLNNVTFAGNKAKSGWSVSTSDEVGGTNDLDVSNSILGDKPKQTCDTPATSPLVSHGGNLEPGVTCELSEKSDLDETDPKLDKLATNIGVPTHALKPDSPAIDFAGEDTACEPLDERNTDRFDGPPQLDPNATNDDCDAGAFEFASEPAE